MDTILEIKNLSFGYNDKLILDNINFEIKSGDYIGIVGPNGSGKSTLLKIVLGLLKPTKGSIKLFGQPMDSFKDWGKIGYVAQKAASFNTSFPATVEEVVAANLYPQLGLFKRIKKYHMEKVYEALELVGMKEYSKRLIGNLSGGQQQRVFIARTLVSSPQIIFLDEPTVGIDIQSQDNFYELLKNLNENMHITIVMISHDIGVITEKANRVACMGEKKLIVHDMNSNVPISKILSEVYGEKMNLLDHHH
ncbi:MAG: zinc transport system ATP-binding protein [Epulopiscium sp.]|jgi:zinc transport system ATP-binding protein|uniref:ATP-binding cassette domain-containing protein n=1 Tax=Defluviitalea raffinosedens TaxID=1450156 RepID=A0A7C8LDL9_9FIRM|nr:ABC transporter ATP-binding protein [Defluviitalea raffinosedens]MBZ4667368.1 zinc transporter ATP-binding protein [Defluviitaleaceae bacterium]MDK2788683.1 zinc transport system ATP-binding protein [Candidatus Epulonipiscium sp.]KAE9632001.1 ATP-binding cassette domain-containing protein [Defluviitalea raffinosedens]MBM7686499.1 zinc transport system ATP-binding protein [Defluviitalea raffinosedens]HHW66414.1 ABC transporter ATP-binding protein [Candidatus Epulonipiscium sp.]